MPPAVSVAIPTYNRRATLRRAVRSALEQTFEDLEVVVSDNASTDGTDEELRELARSDARLRVVRQAVNRGMVANLDTAARLAVGERVMLLSDDDWLTPRCVEAGVELARDRPGAAALGRVAYLRDGAEVGAGQPVALGAPDGARRVRDYFGAVDADHGNSWMYALVPRSVLARLPPMRNVLGFDWLHVAGLAFLAPVEMAGETLICRELGGTSETTERNVRESRLPAAHARIPHFVIAGEVLADVGWRSPAYAALGRRRRLALAADVASRIPLRNARHVAYHLAPQPIRRLRRAHR